MAIAYFLRQSRLLEVIRSYWETDWDSLTREQIEFDINFFRQTLNDLPSDEQFDAIKGYLLQAIQYLYIARGYATSELPRPIAFYDSLQKCSDIFGEIMGLARDPETDAWSTDANKKKREEKSAMDANTLIAAISALIDAITLWRSARDRKEAAETLHREFSKVKKASNPEAIALGNLVPNELLKTMSDRVLECFKKYQKILENDKKYFPEDIDGATDTVIICICHELNRIYKLNHRIPPGKLSKWWDSYKCFSMFN